MSNPDDEHSLRALADRLLFRLERHGARYTLTREVDVASPVRHEDLSLADAKAILETWKLRGFHGG